MKQKSTKDEESKNGKLGLIAPSGIKYNCNRVDSLLNLSDNLFEDLVLQGLKGTVNTRQHCSQCHKKFSQNYINRSGFFCPTCKTRPDRYVVCAKFFGCGELYKDPKTDKVLISYRDALNLLVAINRDWEEKKDRFNPNDWIPAKVAERRIENLVETWLRNHEAEAEKGAKTEDWFNQKKRILGEFIVPFFKGKDIGTIDRDDIERFYHSLLDREYSPNSKGAPKEHYASKYISQIMDILKSFLIRYRKDIPELPKITIVPKREKQRLGLTREIAILENVPERYGYRLAILILLRTAMRINEVVALKVSDFDDGIAWVSKAISADGKMRLSRKSGGCVPYRITPELWQMLLEHIEGRNPDSFLFEINGKPIPTDRLYKVWAKACKQANVKHISLQQASRHSKASEIMDKHKRKALEEIQQQLGHSNMITGQKHYVVE